MPDIGGMLDKIPKLERFCCFDNKNGVMYMSIVLICFWILELISSFFAGTVGGVVWGIIWSIVVICVYGLVVAVIKKDKSRNLLIPALSMSVFNIFVCSLNAIIYFITLVWFGAIVLVIIAGLTSYYFLGLFTVYRSMTAAPTATVEPA